MTEDWERHLERVKEVAEENPRAKIAYFEIVSSKAYTGFARNADKLDRIRELDLPEDMELEEIDSPEQWEYLTDELAEAMETEFMAGAYRDIFTAVENTRPDAGEYAEAIISLKSEYDSEMDVDRLASLDVPENVIVETIEADFDPILDEVAEEYS